MTRFAENTSVPPEKTKAEIEAQLRRYGADQFMSGWLGNTALIGFRVQSRFVRFVLKLPDRNEKQFTTRRRRGYLVTATQQQAQEAWEQAIRQRWRALLLVIKAKLECVESGISTFEKEFLAHIVLPNDQTVGEWISPQLEDAYQSGQMPTVLPLALPPPRTYANKPHATDPPQAP